MPADDFQTRRKLVEHFIARLADDMQGAGSAYAEVHNEKPKDQFPCGALHPQEEGDIVDELEAEFARTEYTPSAIGFAFKVKKAETFQLKTAATMRVFYPVHPTYHEVQSFLQKYAPNDNTIKFPPKYRRIEIDVPLTTETLEFRETNGFEPLPLASRALATALARATARAQADPDVYGVAPNERRTSAARQRTSAELRDATWWSNRVASCTRRSQPSWEAKVFHRVREVEDGWLVELLLGNTTPDSGDRALEPVLFGVTATAVVSRDDLIPNRLREVEAADYRHRSTTLASGRNCDAVVTSEAGEHVIRTDSLPLYVQHRLEERKWSDRRGGDIKANFTALAEPTGVKILHTLAEAMAGYEREWEQIAASAPGAASAPDQLSRSKANFSAEIRRFREGVALLARSDLQQAFCYTNEAFADRFRKNGQPDAGWRLFQLVFLVSEIPAAVARAEGGETHVDRPTVLWYPTGGGKTEAYLALVVFHAFWDRIRGKPWGTTAVAKFPLRMLSIQQFARVVSVIEHAEDVRLRRLEAKGGDPFSVGFYAGGGNTLNILDLDVAPDKADRPSNWTKAFARILADPNALQREERRSTKVAWCPMCRDAKGRPGRIVAKFDGAKPGFAHKCTSCGRVLHLHVTDSEVLRHLPTLIVATIDKLARLATEPWGRALFGEVAAKCEVHGYFYCEPLDTSARPPRPTGKCAVLGCGRPLQRPLANVDPPPALLVQDELHLLTESLGAFASHYETMLIETARMFRRKGVGKGPWHVVGSTATIEGYHYLVRQLYNATHAVRFPQPGPLKTESFYVRENPDEPQRFIVGVRPHGMTHVDTVMKVLLTYYKVALPVAEPAACPRGSLPPPLVGATAAELKGLARRYRTSLTYGINRNEVAQVNTSFTGQLNPILAREGFPTFDPERVLNLTGDNEIEDIQEFLDDMESVDDLPDYPQAVTATSVVSHGVDLEALNSMVFRGMPHRMAEYIQASSRVGRARGVPAVVVNVYNPNRERDASHFESHKDYLELRDILIRNIPTTRFSRQAFEKTFPGLLLHYVYYERAPPDLWKRTTAEGLLKEILDHPSEVEAAVARRLGTEDAPDPNSPLVLRQKAQVPQRVAWARSELMRTSNDPNDRYAANRLKALRSLRDTDETIPIYSGGALR